MFLCSLALAKVLLPSFQNPAEKSFLLLFLIRLFYPHASCFIVPVAVLPAKAKICFNRFFVLVNNDRAVRIYTPEELACLLFILEISCIAYVYCVILRPWVEVPLVACKIVPAHHLYRVCNVYRRAKRLGIGNDRNQ